MHSKDGGVNLGTETASVLGIFGTTPSVKTLLVGEITVFGAVWTRPELELKRIQEELPIIQKKPNRRRNA